MGGDDAKRLYDYFYSKVQAGYAADKVKNGVFQAMMEVALVNDGPVRPPSCRRVDSEHTADSEKVTLELLAQPPKQDDEKKVKAPQPPKKEKGEKKETQAA
jgi:D-tyrosyl-tRNA(Tyr) deacylase